MRSPFRWLLLLAFVVLNGFIVYWAWRNLSDGADEAGDRVQVSRQDPSEPAPSRKSEIVVNPSSTKEELYQASLELQGRTEKMAYDLIAKWKRDPVINLESDELTAAVESLPEADCILLPSGAIAIGSPMLPKPVKQDLDTAVAELLRAYRDATPDAVIKYMSGRGKIVDPALRKRMERAFVKQGISDLAKLTDEDVYRTMWTTFNANPHWSGLVADSSCRQFWDGKNVQFNRVDSFNQNIVIGAPPKQMDQAEYLVHLLRGDQSGPHNFVSTTGSLADAHQADAKVLLCDVQLVMELDESFSHAKVPYLFRFWFNDALQKWQPISKVSFNSSPKGGRLPIELF